MKVVPCGRKDEQKDRKMAKLKVAFRNFANSCVPKCIYWISGRNCN